MTDGESRPRANDAVDLLLPFAVGRRQRRVPLTSERRGPRSFTRDQITQAIRDWLGRYGDLPTVADWEPSRARRAGQEWRAERFEEGRWPSIKVVRREFGTLSAAVRAAGLRPRRAPSRTVPRLRGPEEILRAIREWTRRYGEPPTLADWEPSRARRNGDHWRIARYRRGDWPSTRSVCANFGNFTRAVTAAGVTPRRPGERQQQLVRRRAENRERLEEWRVSAETGLGPGALASRVRQVAYAQAEGSTAGLNTALVDLAATALKWADQLAAGSDTEPVAA